MRPAPEARRRRDADLIRPAARHPGMPRKPSSPDWSAWLESWDRQQEAYLPTREYRFTVMMDVLEARLGRRFRALDLGCGPGSFSARILRRFPAARVVAVDYDPVVRRIGEGALGTMGGRLTWVDAKLGAPDWADRLPPGKYDAAVSTTALHWLTPAQLTRLYSDLGRRLRRGGVLLNGDALPWGRSNPDLAHLAEETTALWLRRQATPPPRGRSAWRRWWRTARNSPELRAEFVEHDRRGAGHPRPDHSPLDAHVQRLRRARFRTVEVVWQIFENRVLYAVR